MITKKNENEAELLALLPKAGDLTQPLLSVLRSQGGAATNEKIVEEVAKLLALPKEAIDIPHFREDRIDGRTELGYRLAWAQTNLKRQGILTQPQKAMWKIASDVDQKAIILEWFNLRYSKPSDNTAGTNYDLGFPINPKEVIVDEFGDKFDSQIIENVSRELGRLSSAWLPIQDYGKYQVSEKSFFTIFSKAIHDIREMAGITISGKQQAYLRMLYARIYAVVESYLCDALSNAILNDQAALRRFISQIKTYDEKISLKQLFESYDGIISRVSNDLMKVTWHNLGTAQDYYKAAYKIYFPHEELTYLMQAVEFRHDIVHRDGRDTNGKERTLFQAEIIKLAGIAERFVTVINESLIEARETAIS